MKATHSADDSQTPPLRAIETPSLRAQESQRVAAPAASRPATMGRGSGIEASTDWRLRHPAAARPLVFPRGSRRPVRYWSRSNACPEGGGERCRITEGMAAVVKPRL